MGSSFLWVFSSWSQGCSAHGFPRVIGSKNYYRRIFWFAASLTSTILFFYQTYVMLEDVFKFPVTVNLEVTLIRKHLIFNHARHLPPSKKSRQVIDVVFLVKNSRLLQWLVFFSSDQRLHRVCTTF